MQCWKCRKCLKVCRRSKLIPIVKHVDMLWNTVWNIKKLAQQPLVQVL